MAIPNKTTSNVKEVPQVDINALKEQLKAEILKDMEKEKQDIIENDLNKEVRSEKMFADLEKSTLKMLKEQKQVEIFIPISDLGDNAPQVVGINGVIYSIPVGKKFMVPEEIYNVWYESYTKTIKANRKMRITKMENQEIEIKY